MAETSDTNDYSLPSNTYTSSQQETIENGDKFPDNSARKTSDLNLTETTGTFQNNVYGTASIDQLYSKPNKKTSSVSNITEKSTACDENPSNVAKKPDVDNSYVVMLSASQGLEDNLSFSNSCENANNTPENYNKIQQERTSMLDNTYYDSSEVATGMVNNTYYETSDTSDCKDNTDEMTDNTYYETGENDRVCEDTEYQYAYSHFEVEGRQRSPYKNSVESTQNASS